MEASKFQLKAKLLRLPERLNGKPPAYQGKHEETPLALPSAPSDSAGSGYRYHPRYPLDRWFNFQTVHQFSDISRFNARMVVSAISDWEIETIFGLDEAEEAAQLVRVAREKGTILSWVLATDDDGSTADDVLDCKYYSAGGFTQDTTNNFLQIGSVPSLFGRCGSGRVIQVRRHLRSDGIAVSISGTSWARDFAETRHHQEEDLNALINVTIRDGFDILVPRTRYYEHLVKGVVRAQSDYRPALDITGGEEGYVLPNPDIINTGSQPDASELSTQIQQWDVQIRRDTPLPLRVGDDQTVVSIVNNTGSSNLTASDINYLTVTPVGKWCLTTALTTRARQLVTLNNPLMGDANSRYQSGAGPHSVLDSLVRLAEDAGHVVFMNIPIAIFERPGARTHHWDFSQMVTHAVDDSFDAPRATSLIIEHQDELGLDSGTGNRAIKAFIRDQDLVDDYGEIQASLPSVARRYSADDDVPVEINEDLDDPYQLINRLTIQEMLQQAAGEFVELRDDFNSNVILPEQDGLRYGIDFHLGDLIMTYDELGQLSLEAGVIRQVGINMDAEGEFVFNVGIGTRASIDPAWASGTGGYSA